MAVQIISTVDLSDRFDIPGSDETWVLPWTTAIISGGNGIQEYFGAVGNRIVVNGLIDSAYYGIISESADADVRVGKTGVIESNYGIFFGAVTGDANFVNAGRIDAATVGIAIETARMTIRNTGTIESDFGIFSYLSGVYRESLDIFSSGSISGISGIYAVAKTTTIDLSETSRIIASSIAVSVAGGDGWTSIVENAGLLRAPAAYDASAGKDTLVNSGLIVGSITLGDGPDTFRSMGGKIHGDIAGEAGDDRFFIDDTSTRIIELAGQGMDRVLSSVSYALVSNGIDLLRLTGRRNIDATGAGGDEDITGNAGRNVLSGLSGADTLSGGKGRDWLEGGDGADTFVFRTGWGNDRIVDFVAAEDRIDLSGWTAIGNFNDLSANHISETSSGVIIRAGNDRLIVAGVVVTDLTADIFDF